MNEDVCTNSECNIHRRNDSVITGMLGTPITTTYVGNYCVISGATVISDSMTLEEVTPLLDRLDLYTILGEGMYTEEIKDIVSKIPTRGATVVYKVGMGSVSDREDNRPVEEYFYADTGKLEEVHRRFVAEVDLWND